jgi:transcriptional regulator with XRE-family HTH domain
MEEESALGNSIKERRHELGFSLNHLADATGLHKSFLSRIESGAVRQPASDSLRRIAAALELPETELWPARSPGTRPATAAPAVPARQVRPARRGHRGHHGLSRPLR